MSLLLIGIITARLLGPEGRGVYSLFFVIVGFGISFSTWVSANPTPIILPKPKY